MPTAGHVLQWADVTRTCLLLCQAQIEWSILLHSTYGAMRPLQQVHRVLLCGALELNRCVHRASCMHSLGTAFDSPGQPIPLSSVSDDQTWLQTPHHLTTASTHRRGHGHAPFVTTSVSGGGGTVVSQPHSIPLAHCSRCVQVTNLTTSTRSLFPMRAGLPSQRDDQRLGLCNAWHVRHCDALTRRRQGKVSGSEPSPASDSQRHAIKSTQTVRCVRVPSLP
jgi:hypothetical protein